VATALALGGVQRELLPEKSGVRSQPQEIELAGAVVEVAAASDFGLVRLAVG